MLHHQVGDGIEAVELFDLILGDVHRGPNVTWDAGDGKYEMGRKNGNWKGDQMNESSNFAFFHTCGNLVEAFNIYRERCVRTRESGTLKMATKLSLIEFCH